MGRKFGAEVRRALSHKLKLSRATTPFTPWLLTTCYFAFMLIGRLPPFSVYRSRNRDDRMSVEISGVCALSYAREIGSETSHSQP
jgi:hypothetical protein